MKHTKLAGILLASVAFLSIGTAVGVTSFKDSKEVDAAIDITDYTACNTKYNDNDASGLLSALRTITSPGSSKTYDDLWTTYKSCYVKSNGKMFDYYSNSSSFTPGTDQAGSYSGEGDVYNREHSIPKSWWGGSTSNQGADPYIVVPTDGYVNNRRQAYPMGMVNSVTYQSDNGFSKLGSAKTSWGYTGTVFEPDDSVKGDFARIVFYAIAKYSGSYDWDTSEGSSTFSGSASTNFGLTNYAVKLYSYWNNLDKPDDWERSVNDKVSTIQKNRNPFIDHPEYANVLWGTNSGYTEYETGVGISSISKTAASLTVGGTTTISAVSSTGGTISWSSSNPNVATVSNGTAASGSNITITGVSSGSATITASITISGTTYSKTCAVTVTNKTLSSISVSGQKTAFTLGETFSFGGTVTAHYSDSTTEDVTLSANFTGYDMSTAGNQTVTVSYSGKTTSYSITVSSSSSSSTATIAHSDTFSPALPTTKDNVNTSSTSHTDTTSSFTFKEQNIYKGSSANYIMFVENKGFLYNTTSLGTVDSVAITYSSGTSTSGKIGVYFGASEQSTYTTTSNATIKGQSKTDTFSNNTSGNGFFQISTSNKNVQITEIVVTYHSSAATKTLSSISLDTTNVQKSFTVGATFNYTGLVVTANYNDSTSATVTPTSVSTPDMSTSGQKTVTVSYTEGEVTKTNTYNITVNAKTLSSISISGQTTAFYEGDEFTFGGTVTAHYSDSSTENVTSSATFSGYTMTTTGQQTVTVSYGGESTSYNITVNAGLLDSIALSGQKTSYKVNDEFSFTGTCTAVFENEYEKSVTPTSVSSPDMSSTGDKTVTVSFTYNGRTKSTTYTIGVSSSTYTGLLEEGRYYIMNEDKTRGLNAAYSNASPSAISLASSNSLTAFDFTLVGNNLYSISVTVKTSTYNLVCNTTAATSNNTNIRVINSFASGLKSIYWSPEAIDNEDTYYLKENTTGTTYRYLSYFTDNSSKWDWRGYVNTSNGQPKINFVKEGSLAEGIANRILNDVTCDNGVHAPSTSIWSTVSTAYSALTITYEKNLLINGVANEQSTNVIEQALAKYDLIIRRYGSSAYSNFLGRNISQAHNIVFANLTDNSSLIVILIATGIVGVGFASLVLLKRRKHD